MTLLASRLLVVCLLGALAACAGALKPKDGRSQELTRVAADPIWERPDGSDAADWYHVLNAGEEALEWRLRAIDSATKSIDMQTFIWELDSVGSLIRERLLDAADRGVKVRVLVDDSFTATVDYGFLAIDRHPGIQIRVFNPYEKRSSQAAARVALNLGDFSRLDHRMHNKVLVADGSAAIVGGRNSAAAYFGYHPVNNFRDMELLVGGEAVLRLTRAFDDFWNDRWSLSIEEVMAQGDDRVAPAPMIERAPATLGYSAQSPQLRSASWASLADMAHSGSSVLLMDKPPQESPADIGERPTQLGEQLLSVIAAAQSEVWLISAYLIPTDTLETAIRDALQRGVRVRILTNSIRSNNHLTAHSAYRNHVQSLLGYGAEVHELRYDARDRGSYIALPLEDKFLRLHAKIMLVDGNLAFIGSSNLDPRSLRINTEMGLLIDSVSLNSHLREVFEPDFSLANAWRLAINAQGQLTWSDDQETLVHQPTHSYMLRLEDWFLSHLPLEGEM